MTELLPEAKPEPARAAYADTRAQWQRGVEGHVGDPRRARSSETARGSHKATIPLGALLPGAFSKHLVKPALFGDPSAVTVIATI